MIISSMFGDYSDNGLSASPSIQGNAGCLQISSQHTSSVVACDGQIQWDNKCNSRFPNDIGHFSDKAASLSESEKCGLLLNVWKPD